MIDLSVQLALRRQSPCLDFLDQVHLLVSATRSVFTRPSFLMRSFLHFTNRWHLPQITQLQNCGFYDPPSKNLFTDSLMVYFNETTALPISDFVQKSWTHEYEKGWNTEFRQGADASNVAVSKSTPATDTSVFNSSTTLNLHVSPYQTDHLVVGSSLRTVRRDIKF